MHISFTLLFFLVGSKGQMFFTDNPQKVNKKFPDSKKGRVGDSKILGLSSRECMEVILDKAPAEYVPAKYCGQ